MVYVNLKPSSFHSRDYSSAGSLYTIILSILQFKRSARLRRIDFQNPLKLSLHLKILDKVEESLIEKGFLSWPVVYFAISSKKQTNRLKAIVLCYKGKVTDRPEQATHIVTCIPPYEPDDDWLRVTRKLDSQRVLVHWWYLPDSYDSILGLDEVGDPDLLDASESRPIGPWKVNGRFITDLEVFHEWMNEKDYEVTDDINEVEQVEASIPQKEQLQEFSGFYANDVDIYKYLGNYKENIIKKPCIQEINITNEVIIYSTSIETF
ncbi:SWI/SNF complex subunit SMARCC2-like [Zophobas morio]|uniref:SWI/SNF complex subunit SMARCC2-like n=1 Tax=Zophobas morio TaxID=2755281 RepID=UPI003082D8AB